MTKLTNLFRTTAAFALLLLAAHSGWASPGGDDWPAWGGPHRNFAVTPGVIKVEQPIELKIAWKKELGSGYSAVSVLDGMAVTMFSDSTFDYAIALDVEDGSELWRFKIGPTFPGRWGSANGPISTPLISQNKVVGLGAGGRLFALDSKTGELVWATPEPLRRGSPGENTCLWLCHLANSVQRYPCGRNRRRYAERDFGLRPKYRAGAVGCRWRHRGIPIALSAANQRWQPVCGHYESCSVRAAAGNRQNLVAL